MNPFVDSRTTYRSPAEFLRAQGGYYDIGVIAICCKQAVDEVLRECELNEALEIRLFEGRMQCRVAKPAALTARPVEETPKAATRGPRSKLSQKELAAIAEDYRNGARVTKLAEEWWSVAGFKNPRSCEHRIYCYLRENKIERDPKLIASRAKLPEDLIQSLIARYECGEESIPKLAEEIWRSCGYGSAGSCRGMLYTEFEKRGIDRRRPGGDHRSQKRRVAARTRAAADV